MGYNVQIGRGFDVNEFYDFMAKEEYDIGIMIGVIKDLSYIYSKKRSKNGDDDFLKGFDTHEIPYKYFTQSVQDSLCALATFLTHIDKENKYYYDRKDADYAFYRAQRLKVFKEVKPTPLKMEHLMMQNNSNMDAFTKFKTSENYFLMINKEGKCDTANICNILKSLFNCDIRDDVKIAIEIY